MPSLLLLMTREEAGGPMEEEEQELTEWREGPKELMGIGVEAAPMKAVTVCPGCVGTDLVV